MALSFDVPVTTIKTYTVSDELWLALMLYVYTEVQRRQETSNMDFSYSSRNYANKVHAIKLIRDIYGLGLKDAKDFVDCFWEQLHQHSRDRYGWQLID